MIKKYISNICGLSNEVWVAKIKVDSFENDIPSKYTKLKSTTLYRDYNDQAIPRKLYRKTDYKEFYVWNNEVPVDTIKGPWKFENNAYYLFSSSDAHTNIFMFIDNGGKRSFKELSGKADLINF